MLQFSLWIYSSPSSVFLNTFVRILCHNMALVSAWDTESFEPEIFVSTQIPQGPC